MRFFREVREHSETESACGKQLGNGRDAGLLAILPCWKLQMDETR